MEILDKELPPPLEALYHAVVDLRPDAGLKFVRFVPQPGMRSGGLHVSDYTGDSEIRLDPDYDFAGLAHALLHCLLYRKGYPVASTLAASDKTYSAIARVAGCASCHIEAAKEDLKAPLMEGPGIVDAWYLADALSQGLDEAEALAQACRAEAPDAWALVERLLETVERCREPSAMRRFRAMTDLVYHFDGLIRASDPRAVPASRAVIVSLVLSEPQLSRPAERLIEIVPLERDVVGFYHKQDRALFHIRFSLPGKQKREIAEVRADLKLRAEDFLDNYWVPYTVDLKAAARTAK
jgi:hypothetical protein